MKTSILLVATLLGLAIASAQAQTQSSTTTSYVQTSKIVGMKVKDSSGQEVGVVKDVVLDRNTGCMAYTVLSTGSRCLSGSHGNGLAECDCGDFTGRLTQSDRFANGNSENYGHIDSVAASDRNPVFRGGVDRRAQKPSSRRK